MNRVIYYDSNFVWVGLNHLNILCFKTLYYQILYCSIYKNRNYQDIMKKSYVCLEGKNYIEKGDQHA